MPTTSTILAIWCVVLLSVASSQPTGDLLQIPQPWSRTLMNSSLPGFPVVAGPLLFNQDVTGRLHAFNIQSGMELWHVDFHCHLIPYAGFDFRHPRMVFTGCKNHGSVFALKLEDGDTVWKVDGLRRPTIAPMIVDRGNQLLVVRESGYLAALNPNNGASLWNASQTAPSAALNDSQLSSPKVDPVCEVPTDMELPVVETMFHLFGCFHDHATGINYVAAIFKNSGKFYQAFNYAPLSVYIPSEAPVMSSYMKLNMHGKMKHAVGFFITNTTERKEGVVWGITFASIDTTAEFGFVPRLVPLHRHFTHPIKFVQYTQQGDALAMVSSGTGKVFAINVIRAVVAWGFKIPTHKKPHAGAPVLMGPLRDLLVSNSFMILRQDSNEASSSKDSYITVLNMKHNMDYTINVNQLATTKIVATDQQLFFGTNDHMLGYNITGPTHGQQCLSVTTYDQPDGLSVVHPHTFLTRLVFVSSLNIYSYPIQP